MYKIAYQGIKGSFSFLTAVRYFGKKNLFIGMGTFLEVFELVENNQVDYAVLPIENSLIGSIYENYDLVSKYNVEIVGESYTQIEHCLLSTATDTMDTEKQLRAITKIFSHPKAIEQCSIFFCNHPWMEAINYFDTAGAAADIAKMQNPNYAAIANISNAELYNLKVLQKNIEDNHHNYSRFMIISKSSSYNDKDADKCSIMLTLHHKPGTLVEILKLFSLHKLNLTKIESRPIHGKSFEYIFFIDFRFSKKIKIKEILDNIKNKAQTFKILGFYKGQFLP